MSYVTLVYQVFYGFLWTTAPKDAMKVYRAHPKRFDDTFSRHHQTRLSCEIGNASEWNTNLAVLWRLPSAFHLEIVGR